MRCHNCSNSKKEYKNDYECSYMPQCLMQDVERRLSYESFDLSVGNKIKFMDDRCWWTIRAKDDRFLICVRQGKEDWYYTICDLQECIRGKDNYIDAYYDYIDCPEIDLREALYRLNMNEGKPIRECKNLPEDIKQRQLKSINTCGPVPQNQQWLDNLEISHRNWVPLDIREVKNGFRASKRIKSKPRKNSKLIRKIS